MNELMELYFSIDEHGFFENGINIETSTIYNKRGFSKEGYHKNKTLYDDNNLDINLKYPNNEYYDDRGFYPNGQHKDTLLECNELGFRKDKTHVDTNLLYNNRGFFENGIHRITKLTTDKDDRDIKYKKITGVYHDENSFYPNGINLRTGKKYDEYGFTQQGINILTKTRFDKNGTNRERTLVKVEDKIYSLTKDSKEGFDILTETHYITKEEYNEEGFNIYGIHKDTNTSTNSHGLNYKEAKTAKNNYLVSGKMNINLTTNSPVFERIYPSITRENKVSIQILFEKENDKLKKIHIVPPISLTINKDSAKWEEQDTKEANENKLQTNKKINVIYYKGYFYDFKYDKTNNQSNIIFEGNPINLKDIKEIDNRGFFGTENIHTAKKYDQRGFSLNKIHVITKSKYDEFGYDADGYNKYGYNSKGLDKNGIYKYTSLLTKKIQVTEEISEEERVKLRVFDYYDTKITDLKEYKQDYNPKDFLFQRNDILIKAFIEEKLTIKSFCTKYDQNISEIAEVIAKYKKESKYSKQLKEILDKNKEQTINVAVSNLNKLIKGEITLLEIKKFEIVKSIAQNGKAEEFYTAVIRDLVTNDYSINELFEIFNENRNKNNAITNLLKHLNSIKMISDRKKYATKYADKLRTLLKNVKSYEIPNRMQIGDKFIILVNDQEKEIEWTEDIKNKTTEFLKQTNQINCQKTVKETLRGILKEEITLVDDKLTYVQQSENSTKKTIIKNTKEATN